MKIHAYTSFSYSYLNRARVWARSLKKIHPDWEIWAIITDVEPDGFLFDLLSEPFDRLLTVTDLFGDETERWLFGMDVIEACTAVKGRALEVIFNDSNPDKVFYFDPDTAVFNSMEPVCKLLDSYSIVLTPHQVDPESSKDNMAILDNEVSSLQYGVFNLGFIAVANNFEGRRFSKWWDDRLQNYCHDRLDIGIFVDQKWCNLVPCFFDDVKILRDPGYNCASWNISQREFSVDKDGAISVNGVPLRFFHFTKLGPIGDSMTARYARDNIEVYEVWSAYKRWISMETEASIPERYWYYGSFSNGKPIKKKLRELYRARKDLQNHFDAPRYMYDEIFSWASSNGLLNLLE